MRQWRGGRKKCVCVCVGVGGRMYSSVTPECKMYRWFDQNTILRRGKSYTMSTYAVSECGCGVWWGWGGGGVEVCVWDVL